MAAHPQDNPSVPAAAERRAENLALQFQELFTAVVRLRTDRQEVSDAAAFRRQVLQAIKIADRNAREQGYTGEDIRLAVFAVVAFLDESILNLSKPIFAEWVRKPLQEELFGRHVAGEIFFENLERILGRRDTHATADLLEVYQLCLLLSYQGRYSISGKGELRALIGQIEDKLKRIRQSRADLSPHWRLPEGEAAPPTDPWFKRLAIGAIATTAVTITFFIGYSLALGSGVTSVEDLAGQVRIGAAEPGP